MNIRLSTSHGTIEADGSRDEISSLLSVYSGRILGVMTLAEEELEAIRSGDLVSTVIKEKGPPPKAPARK